MRASRIAIGPALASVLLALPGSAQVVEGVVFEDLDADGLREPGEPLLPGLGVAITGPAGAVTGTTTGTGFAIPAAAGCHAVALELADEPDPGDPGRPPFFRRGLPDQTPCAPDGSAPVGLLRHGSPRSLGANLAAPGFRYVSLGDSIAAGTFYCGSNTYVNEVRTALDCLAGRAIAFENRAELGWHSEDLLTPNDGARANPQFIPNVVAAAPDLVTISIGGNDFLNTEPGTVAAQTYPYAQADLDESFLELIATRRSIQEILSTLVSELPDADVEINTVYDNRSGECDTTDFHAAAAALWNQMLRDLAWGQRRSVLLAEVEPEIAHQDVLRSTCCGQQGAMCFDRIHPTAAGARIIREAVLESLGRVEVAPAGTTSGYQVGLVRQVATLLPSRVEVLAGTATEADEALALDRAGAAASFDGAWMELSGFELPPGITPRKVVVGVRYRTTGTVVDDRHRFDASFVDFAPPTLDFTGWDTQTPLVGGSGTRGNIGAPSVVNATPNVAAWRSVSAHVTLNAVDDGRVTGYFEWPDPTPPDVARLRVRLTTEAVGTPDAAQLEWDGAWAWVYGESAAAPAPGEVSPPGAAEPLRVRKAPGGAIVSWQQEPASATYRVYRGALGSWTTAIADGALPQGGCTDALSFLDTFAPDSGRDWYWLVAGVSSSLVQGPLGADSEGSPRASGAAACP